MRQPEKTRKATEATATFGLIIIAAALIGPFANLLNSDWGVTFRWLYAAGAVIYTIARVVGAADREENTRLRRLRRLECWGGFAFIIAAAFWFYNQQRLGATAGNLALLRETVLFTLVGALIQIISAWRIDYTSRKTAHDTGSDKNMRS